MLVSICTPTFNRRPFIPSMIQCFKHQDYKGPMEWIIVDDGTDKIEDLITAANIPEIKYYKIEGKLSLGKKRNLMHQYSKGDIIVYMDDDDYYPPERVSHAVEMLQSHPNVLVAGATTLFTYFKEIDKIVQFGPYGPNHATAGTFAFKKQLLMITGYDDEQCLAEEKHFLKNYTIPMVQLDPRKVILVCSHNQNTFDKRTLLENPNPRTVHFTTLKIKEFIKNSDLRHFFKVKMHEDLLTYKPGDPSMKPDVIQHMNKLKKEREFTIQYGNKLLSGTEIINQLNQQQHYIKLLHEKIAKLEQELKKSSTP
jgi:glycosyltransferase involved in cell wall biosynthesis